MFRELLPHRFSGPDIHGEKDLEKEEKEVSNFSELAIEMIDLSKSLLSQQFSPLLRLHQIPARIIALALLFDVQNVESRRVPWQIQDW